MALRLFCPGGVVGSLLFVFWLRTNGRSGCESEFSVITVTEMKRKSTGDTRLFVGF
jgi:hypothetical protein